MLTTERKKEREIYIRKGFGLYSDRNSDCTSRCIYGRVQEGPDKPLENESISLQVVFIRL